MNRLSKSRIEEAVQSFVESDVDLNFCEDCQVMICSACDKNIRKQIIVEAKKLICDKKFREQCVQLFVAELQEKQTSPQSDEIVNVEIESSVENQNRPVRPIRKQFIAQKKPMEPPKARMKPSITPKEKTSKRSRNEEEFTPPEESSSGEIVESDEAEGPLGRVRCAPVMQSVSKKKEDHSEPKLGLKVIVIDDDYLNILVKQLKENVHATKILLEKHPENLEWSKDCVAPDLKLASEKNGQELLKEENVIQLKDLLSTTSEFSNRGILEQLGSLMRWWRVVRRALSMTGIFTVLESRRKMARKNQKKTLKDMYDSKVEKLSEQGANRMIGFRHARTYNRLGKFLLKHPFLTHQTLLVSLNDWVKGAAIRNSNGSPVKRKKGDRKNKKYLIDFLDEFLDTHA